MAQDPLIHDRLGLVPSAIERARVSRQIPLLIDRVGPVERAMVRGLVLLFSQHRQLSSSKAQDWTSPFCTHENIVQWISEGSHFVQVGTI